MNKRFVSMLLTLLMIIGLVPSAGALEKTENTKIKVQSLEEELNNSITSTTSSQAVVEEDEEENDENKYPIKFTSNGTTYMKESFIEVNDGEMELVVVFNMGSLITIKEVKVNEELTEAKVGDVINNTLTIKVKINSLEDNINLGLSIKTPFATMTPNLYIKDIKLVDGNYNVDYDSNGARHIKENVLEVKDGKMKMKTTFNSGSFITINGVKVNDNSVDSEVKNGEDNTLIIETEINSLKDNINIDMTIAVPAISMVHNYDIYFKNIRLPKVEINDDKEENSGSGTDNDDTTGDGDNDSDNDNTEGDGNVDSDNEVIKDGNYTIQNKILKTGTTETSLASGYIHSTSNVVVKNGQYNVELSIKDMTVLSDIEVSVNKLPVKFNVVRNDDGTGSISFDLKEFDSEILIGCVITVKQLGYVSKTNFNVKFDKSTLKEGTFVAGDANSDEDKKEEEDKDDEEEEDEDDFDIDDGTYTIKNNVLKEDSDSESHARSYLEKESVLNVKNGKIYVTLKFNHGKMMSDTSIKVNGKKVSYTVVKNSGNNYYIKFKIGALDDEILVTTTIDTGIPAVGVHSGIKFRVELRESTLKEDDDADDYDDDEDEEDDEETEEDEKEEKEENDASQDKNDSDINVTPDTIKPENNLGSGQQSNKSTYKINNKIITDSEIGYQAARSAVNEISYMEVENNVKYMTVGFSQTDVMNNIRLSINGQNVNYEVTNKNDTNKTMTIRFKIPSVTTRVTITTNIAMMGRDTSFGLEFLESTLQLISSQEANSGLTSGNGSSSGVLNDLLATNPGSNNSGSQGNSSVNSNGGKSESSEELVNEALKAKQYFKTYTIENDVISNSAMGRTMARKYLNSTSLLEDIDGKLYLTLTFTGTNSMENFRFEVNGESVEYSLVLSDESEGIKSFKFPINSCDDSIQVYMHVKPMNMDINFGVKLYSNSMVLIDEGVVTDDDIEIESTGNDLLEKTVNELSKDNNKGSGSSVKVATAASTLTLGLNYIIIAIINFIKKKKLLFNIRKNSDIE